MNQKEILELIGDPKEVALELEQFREAALVFSSDKARLIEHYPKQWVAVQGKEVVANSRSLPALIKKLKRLGIKNDQVMVRYIDKNLRTFIL